MASCQLFLPTIFLVPGNITLGKFWEGSALYPIGYAHDISKHVP